MRGSGQLVQHGEMVQGLVALSMTLHIKNKNAKECMHVKVVELNIHMCIYVCFISTFK